MSNTEQNNVDQNEEQYESIDDQYADPNDENADPIVPSGWTTGNDEPSNPPVVDPFKNVPQGSPNPAPVAVPATPAEEPATAPQAVNPVSGAEEVAPPVEDRVETNLNAQEITALKNKLRAEAERETLDNHRPEYHEIAARKFAEHGLEFTRRMSKEERAEQQLRKLLADNPALAASLQK